MKDELTVLHDAFGPDPEPPAEARARARSELLALETARPPAGRWVLRVGLTVAVAAAAAIGVVVVENLGTVDDQGRSHPIVAGFALPFPQPASAAEVLENAAWAAGQQQWHGPRPDQFMYNESRRIRNDRDIEAEHPNDPLVPGRTRVVLEQVWKRVDGKVMARTEAGRIVTYEQGGRMVWGQVPYADLAGLTTPEKVRAWDQADKSLGINLDALLGQYVLPPAVQAAVFRTIAQWDGVRLDPDAINLDGRPAIGLGRIQEGYLSQQLLFDKETYALIGERMVAIADHTNVGDDGTSYTKKGDVYRQVIYTKAVIVDKVGDTQ